MVYLKRFELLDDVQEHYLFDEIYIILIIQ